MDKNLKHNPVIFYYIVAHKLPEQLLELVNAIQTKNTIICIHIDAKSDISQFKKHIKETNQLYFITKRGSVYWAGFSQVKCTLLGMKEFLKHQATHFILLSGQDFPIKSNNYILNFLSEKAKFNFISYAHINTQWPNAIERFNRFYFIDFFSSLKVKYTATTFFINKLEGLINKTQQLFNRKPLPHIEYYAGGSWFILNSSAVNYILDYIALNPNFVSFFEKTNYSDEIFFQTLLLNSPLKSSIINNNLRFVLFNKNEANASTLTQLNYQDLITTDNLFARKFDINTDHKIIHLLNNYIAS